MNHINDGHRYLDENLYFFDKKKTSANQTNQSISTTPALSNHQILDMNQIFW